MYSNITYMKAVHYGMAHSEPDLVEVGLRKLKNNVAFYYHVPFWCSELMTKDYRHIKNGDMSFKSFEDAIWEVTESKKDFDAMGLAFLSLKNKVVIDIIEPITPMQVYYIHLFSAIEHINKKHGEKPLVKVAQATTIYEEPPWWIFDPNTSIGALAIKRYVREFGGEQEAVEKLFFSFQQYPIMSRSGYYEQHIADEVETYFDTDVSWCQNLWEEYARPKYIEYVEDLIHGV